MKTFDDTSLGPLTTDALIEQRVGEIVGRAISRQLWFMFVDEDNLQLPMIIPMDLPNHPGDDLDLFAAKIKRTSELLDAAAVIVVIERRAGDDLTPVDIAWVRGIASSFETVGVTLRGIALSHQHGVRWIARDHYSAR
ncbi:hypothetical protein [Diaminobutyricimonas sp. LJ205]|uniref:hypothetical protein n=1 Tax=Diaminobutyricimonas sp. LJ205 TaxID=2683590 RepID=UPI0012F4A7C9|nr:hypothetical protein [Diaminobutyricimonas sp. LJ205]